MIKLIGFLLVVVLSYLCCYYALKKEKKWNQAHNVVLGSTEYLAVDLLVFLLIAELPMIIIIVLTLFEMDFMLWDIVVGSGIAMACSLFCIGNIVRKIYSVLREHLLAKIGCRDFENEMAFVFLLVCVAYVASLVWMREWKGALTFIAIVIGKFVWFDSTPKSIKMDFMDKYSQITCCPLGTICAFLFIAATASTREETLTLAAALGSVFAFILFAIQQKEKK